MQVDGGNVARGPLAKMWTGVLNNYTEEELNALTQLDCPELVIDKEVGESGTPHLHLFLHLEKRSYMSALKKLNDRVHWEVVRDRQACIDYCSKGEVVLSRLLARPSKRDLAEAIECMQSQGLAGCARAFPYQYVLHSRGLQALEYARLECETKPVPQVSWYWGNTGSGKTRTAFEGVDQNDIYICSGPNTKHGALWWDGYTGQRRVILDDFRPWWCEFSFLLRLLDRYPLRVQVKGGFVNFVPEEIIITTPKNIEETFGAFRSEEDLAQIKRRVKKVVHFVEVALRASESKQEMGF